MVISRIYQLSMSNDGLLKKLLWITSVLKLFLKRGGMVGGEVGSHVDYTHSMKGRYFSFHIISFTREMSFFYNVPLHMFLSFCFPYCLVTVKKEKTTWLGERRDNSQASVCVSVCVLVCVCFSVLVRVLVHVLVCVSVWHVC